MEEPGKKKGILIINPSSDRLFLNQIDRFKILKSKYFSWTTKKNSDREKIIKEIGALLEQIETNLNAMLRIAPFEFSPNKSSSHKSSLGIPDTKEDFKPSDSSIMKALIASREMKDITVPHTLTSPPRARHSNVKGHTKTRSKKTYDW